MDRRRLLLILAVFVAVIGTALVFLYVQGADKRASNQYDNVNVLKATQNITAGESYDAALAAGKISLQPVPQNQLNQGYEIDTTALKGKIASVPIFPVSRSSASQFGDHGGGRGQLPADPEGHDRDLGEPDRPRPRGRQRAERLAGRDLRDRDPRVHGRRRVSRATCSPPACCCPT